MDALNRAKTHAMARRKDMMKSIEAVRERFTVAQLAEDVLSFLDPDLSFPRWVKSAVKARPLVAALLLAGAGWLVASQNGIVKAGPRPRRGSPSPSPSTAAKETKDESQPDSRNG